MGIYRLSGTTSAVQKLKAAFDQGESRRVFFYFSLFLPPFELANLTLLSHPSLPTDVDSVDLDEDAWADINVVSSTLKLWFRELPDPLFTYALYPQFMEAARECPSTCFALDALCRCR